MPRNYVNKISKIFILFVIFFKICYSVRFHQLFHDVTNPLYSPKVTKIKFNDIKNYELKYEFWKSDHNYVIFNFNPKHEMPSAINQKLLVSKDGGRSFNRWRPMVNGIPLYVDQFVAINYALFGISYLNQTFFYADKTLNIFSIQRYETGVFVNPSRIDPAFIYKLVNKGYQVCHILLYIKPHEFSTKPESIKSEFRELSYKKPQTTDIRPNFMYF
ncbi:hypothetical protein RF11_16366 [Thelohanellus kitauei]|uniref:Uncharacterized protein n=1 Tax=Thelohanellus kitauei TaxID=669202 RepID=A0A0C2IE38_THEKT|nr:hypothetical protein RF11_16366 [Thelohanellus kitauei]